MLNSFKLVLDDWQHEKITVDNEVELENALRNAIHQELKERAGNLLSPETRFENLNPDIILGRTREVVVEVKYSGSGTTGAHLKGPNSVQDDLCRKLPFYLKNGARFAFFLMLSWNGEVTTQFIRELGMEPKPLRRIIKDGWTYDAFYVQVKSTDPHDNVSVKG